MNLSNFYCALACIVIFICLTGFSSSSNMNKDSFNPKNCTSDEQCNKICFKGENLYSICDPNGTCICACNEPSEIPSSYTSACAGHQPDGLWRDYCDRYCTQEYLRPCRYCSDSNENFYCTCVCNVNNSTQTKQI